MKVIVKKCKIPGLQQAIDEHVEMENPMLGWMLGQNPVSEDWPMDLTHMVIEPDGETYFMVDGTKWSASFMAENRNNFWSVNVSGLTKAYNYITLLFKVNKEGKMFAACLNPGCDYPARISNNAAFRRAFFKWQQKQG